MRLNLRELEVREHILESLFFALQDLLHSDYQPSLMASLDFSHFTKVRDSLVELKGAVRSRPKRLNPIMEAAFLEECEMLQGPPISEESELLATLLDTHQKAFEAAVDHLLQAAERLNLSVVEFLEHWMFLPLFQLPDPVRLIRSACARYRWRVKRPSQSFVDRVVAEASDPGFIERLLEDEELGRDRVLIHN